MAELVGDGESLALGAGAAVDNHHRNRAALGLSNVGDQAVDAAKRRRQDLDAPILKHLNQAGHGFDAEPPVGAKGACATVRLNHAHLHGEGRFARLVSLHARQSKQIFHREIALQQPEDLGFHGGFLALAADGLPPELDAL